MNVDPNVDGFVDFDFGLVGGEVFLDVVGGEVFLDVIIEEEVCLGAEVFLDVIIEEEVCVFSITTLRNGFTL